MLKCILAFLIGFVCASALFIFIVEPADGRNSFQNGYRQGMVAAQFDIARRIPTLLGGDLHKADILTNSTGILTNDFLEVKDATILVVERNGVKTLRDYDSNPKD